MKSRNLPLPIVQFGKFIYKNYSYSYSSKFTMSSSKYSPSGIHTLIPASLKLFVIEKNISSRIYVISRETSLGGTTNLVKGGHAFEISRFLFF